MKKKYVVGFAFNPEKSKVLLIQKNRPAWQAGKFNGIGGKIESFDESVAHAMTREFFEEAGLLINSENWTLFSILNGSDFELHCFYTTSQKLDDYISVTDEVVCYLNIDDLYKNKFNNCISNLSWLIGMCLDSDIQRIFSDIKYN